MSDDNVVKFPKIHTKNGSPNDILEHAKGWDYEDVVIIGFCKTSETVLVTGKDGDKRSLLEMSELLRTLYLMQKGYL